MARALVTGGTGFVGANLVRRLLADGHAVHLLVRPHHNRSRLNDVWDQLTAHTCALSNESAVREAVAAARPDWVFHLAAYGAYSWQRDTAQMIATNVSGTAALLAATRDAGVSAFVHTGSSSEYGFKDHPSTETEWLEPNSEYAVTKAAATHLCQLAARRDKRRLRTLRLYSIFGPYEDPGRLMPTLITHGLRGELPPLVSPTAARDFVYVADAVDALLLAATHPSADPAGIYNVGSGRQLTMREVVETARRQLPIAVEPTWDTLPGRVWDTACWVADPRRIEADLGWRATTPFETGFRQMIEWFRKNPHR